jgi:hypothetical protein
VSPYEVAIVLARLVFDDDLETDRAAETWSDLAKLPDRQLPAEQVVLASLHLSETARLHVEDKATGGALFGDEGACLDAGH